MNTLRIVFGFIVLVCAVAFASAAFVLTREATNWREKHDALKKDTDARIAERDASIAKLNGDITAAVAEREKWKGQYEALFTEIGKRDTDIIGLNNRIKELEGFKKTLEDETRAIREQLTVQTKNNDDLAKKCEELRLAKEAAEKAERDAKDKLAAAEDDILNLRNQLGITKVELRSAKDLNQRYAEVFGENGLRLAQAAPAPVPLISGQVTNADNRMGLVSISVGKDDGITVGMTFEVVRPDVKQYVGRVRAIEVHDGETVCRVVAPMTEAPIKEGDHVTTRIR